VLQIINIAAFARRSESRCRRRQESLTATRFGDITNDPKLLMKIEEYRAMTVFGTSLPLARRGGGFIGRMISFFIRVVIYDICITGISQGLGVSRMVALFIFLGLLLAISAVGYVVKQRVAPGIED